VRAKIAALHWSAVDLGEAVVRVRRSYTGGEVGTPKNRERRDVDLISDVVELLGWWRSEDAASTRPNTLVFPAEGMSGFLSPSTLLRRDLYPA
jgi:integrase